MKRMIYGLSMAATLLCFAACEKDNVNPLTGKKKPVTSSEKAVPVVTVSVSYSCGARICNLIESVPNPGKYNMLTMQKSGSTSFTYSLYERTFNSGGIEVYTRYAQFPCSLASVDYASGLVNNGTMCLVCSTDNANSPALPGVTQVYVNGVLQSPAVDTDYDIVPIGNYEGQTGCGDPNG